MQIAKTKRRNKAHQRNTSQDLSEISAYDSAKQQASDSSTQLPTMARLLEHSPVVEAQTQAEKTGVVNFRNIKATTQVTGLRLDRGTKRQCRIKVVYGAIHTRTDANICVDESAVRSFSNV